MKELIRALYKTFICSDTKTWKRNTNDDQLLINCIRSMMMGLLNIIDGLFVIITLGFYKPEFANDFILNTIKERME